MKNLTSGKIFKQLVAFIMIFLMCNANIFGVINPFGYAFCFALVKNRHNALLVALYFCISSLVLDFCLSGLIITLSVCSGIILIYIIQKLFKKILPEYAISIIMLICQSAHIYFNSYSSQSLIYSIVTLIIGFVCFFVFSISLSACVKRGKALKFTIDEKICNSFLIIALASGVSSFYIGGVNFTGPICLLFLFLFSRIAPQMLTVIFSTLIGIGVGLSTMSIIPLGVYAIWSTMMIIFRENKKIVTAIILLACDIVIGCFLGAYESYGLINLITTTIAICLACLISDKKLKSLAITFGATSNLAKDFIKSSKDVSLKNKLVDISRVFYEMENVYHKLLIGEVNKEQAIQNISYQVMQKTCKNCEHYKKCYEGKIDMKSAYMTLAESGIYKNRVSFIDLPNILSTDCVRVQTAIANTNMVIESYNTEVKETQNKDKSNIQVAQQLGATANLIYTIAQKVVNNTEIDYEKSVDVYDELIIHDICASDVVVLKNSNGIDSIILALNGSDVVNPYLIYSIERVLKIKVKIAQRVESKTQGVVILIVRPSGALELTCGVSVCSKDVGGVSGDNYTLMKLTDTKYLYAICDGMGSGKLANSLSMATISLIENFYRAGFESSTVVDSVNKLILPAGEDNFCTVDSFVIDSSNGRVDFLKIGSSVSIIKSQNKSQIIECESLPMGILERIKPTSKTVYISSGDIIVLASDGVVDSFGSIENYFSFINNERLQNVQLLADNILEEAISRSKENKDDMTVLTIKAVRKS